MMNDLTLPAERAIKRGWRLQVRHCAGSRLRFRPLLTGHLFALLPLLRVTLQAQILHTDAVRLESDWLGGSRPDRVCNLCGVR